MSRDDLELLITRFIDGRATPAEIAALSDCLESDEGARVLYLRIARLHATLATEEERPASVPADVTTRPARAGASRWLWPIAAVLALGIGLVAWRSRNAAAPIPGPIVATFGELRDARWVAPGSDVRPGDALRAGQRLELSAGSAELRFASGAVATLLGPCTLEPTSGNGAFLALGHIKVRADSVAAKGFTVTTRTARLVDVGTEFVAAVAPDGQSRVDVTEGEVHVMLDGVVAPQRVREGDALTVEAGNAQVLVRIERGDGTADFHFPTIASPSGRDAADRSAGRASIRVARGDLHVTAPIPTGPAELLLDGRGQTTADSPAESVFFGNNSSGALLLDLGRPLSISRINTYSWHRNRTDNRVRAVQKFTLFGATGDTPPAVDAPPSETGWQPIARVDSDDFFRVMHPLDRPAQQACSITGAQGAIGRYRYLLWLVEPTRSPNPVFFNNTFYAEFDVFGEP